MPTNEKLQQVSKDGTTIKEMVSEWLKANGYQGLCNKYGECGCGFSDELMVCGNCMSRDCTAAYEFKCYACVHFDDCEKRDGNDYMFSPDDDWCGEYERVER